MPIPRYSLHRLRHWLPCRSALLCSGMTPGCLARKHNEPGFAGGGVQYRLFNRPFTRFINWQMIGAIFVLLVAWYSCHNGFALPFLWLPYCYG